MKIMRWTPRLMTPLLILASFSIPANAQATRTWVSGVGDDANPCSRTAPCKTFAGAISKTAAAGEIDCLDPGGFGAVTITKSIIIDCLGTLGSTLNTGTQGFVINALTTDVVTIRNVSINGGGTTFGTNGINVLQAKLVNVENVTINNQSNSGIQVSPSGAANIKLVANNVTISNATNGVILNAPSGTVLADLHNVRVANATTDGIRVGTNSKAVVSECELTNNGQGVNTTAATADAMVVRSVLASNTNGVQATLGIIGVASNVIRGNGTGINNTGGSVATDGQNFIGGNGLPTSGTVSSGTISKY